MTLKEIYANFNKNMKKVADITDYYYNNNCDFKSFYDETMNNGFYESDECKTFINMAIRMVIVQIIITFVLPSIVIALVLPYERWIIKLSLVLFIGLGLNFIILRYLRRNASSFNETNNLMSYENRKEAKNNNDYELLFEDEKRTLNVYNNMYELTSCVRDNNSFIDKIYNMYCGDFFTFCKLYLKYLNAEIYLHARKGLFDMVVSIISTITSDFKDGKNVFDSEDSIINYVNEKFDEVFIKSVYKNIIPSSNIVNHAIIIYYMSKLLKDWKQCDEFNKDDVMDIANHLVLYKIISYGLDEIENKLFLTDDGLRDFLSDVS